METRPKESQMQRYAMRSTGSLVHACKEYITPRYGNVKFFVGLDRNDTHDLESRTSHKLLTAAVSSSVVAFLVIFVMTSATGVACGYYFMRRRRRKQSSSSSQPTEPLYDDVILPQASAVEHHLEQDLELKENMAYGAAKPTDRATDPLHEDMNAHQEQGLELKENMAYGAAKPTDRATDPLHEDMNAHQEQGLELKENVAYGTTKSTTH